MNANRECACHTYKLSESDDIFNAFINLRDKCLALKKILIPDKGWAEFQNHARAEFDEAFHQYITLLAFRREYLYRITKPIHNFLLAGDEINSKCIKQYRMDLRERWMLKETSDDRHSRYRIFVGKLVELLFAQWLEERGWQILNLEAWGGENDIDAVSPNRTPSAIEIKYIGMSTLKFEAILDSLKNRPSLVNINPYFAANYLWFRIFEAAQQLRKSTNQNYVVIVIEDWNEFDFALENFIDWNDPIFFETEDWRNVVQNENLDLPSSKAILDLLENIGHICMFTMGQNFNLKKIKIV